MRYYPDSEEELQKELKSYAVEPWAMDQLKRNWSYLGWGPHEDYMATRDPSHPNSYRMFDSWSAFRKSFVPGKLPTTHEDRSGGEVVGWYFGLERKTRGCVECEGEGLNLETRQIHADWYDFDRTGRKWCHNITQDEADKLVEDGRLYDLVMVRTKQALDKLVEDGRIPAEKATELWEGRDTKHDGEWSHEGVTYQRTFIKWRDSVPAEEVNAWSSGRGMGHDAINRWICVKQRCQRLGVWGHCKHCDGEGRFPDEDQGRLQIVLWIVNPQTGQNYGVEVDNLKQEDLDDVHDFLGGMRDRLVTRLDLPQELSLVPGQDFEKTFGRLLKSHGRGESMMWTQDGSVMSNGGGWATPHHWNSWEEFCWPTHYKYGDRNNHDRIPKDHPKFEEFNTGKPAYGLDDLNELAGVRFEYGPHNQKIERVHFWILHPRKGCSCRLTIHNIGPQDYLRILDFVNEGRERARERLDPASTSD